MIKVIIIDDEALILESIALTVESYCPNVAIVARAKDVKSGVAAINENAPDLVLLDISLPDGSGFDLLRHFDKPDFKVIFISGYLEYAINAIKVNAVDFILKPIDEEELALAINKAIDLISYEEKLHLRNLEENLKALRKTQMIILKTSEQIHAVNTEQIIHILGEGSYSTIHVSDGRKIMVSKPLIDFEESLAGQGFYRIHKSHIINIKHLTCFDKADGGYVILTNGIRVPVASRKREMLLEIFEKLA